MRLFPSKGHTFEPKATPDEVTIRRAYPDDVDALVRLAALDCRRPLPAGDLLVAEVDGQLWAAVSVSSSLAIADPFRPSAGLVRLLRLRAAQLDVAAPHAPRRRGARLKPVAARRQPIG